MRAYLLLLPIVFLFLGCKEEEVIPEEIPQTVEELIQGDWYVVNEKYEYYNSSNELIHQTSGISVQGDVKITDWEFTENHSTGTLKSGYYSISDIVGEKYINISHDQAISSTFRIALIDKSEMVWVKESYGKYYHNGAGMSPSAKTLFYISFKRKQNNQ